jgi:cytochrome c oxidase subunit 2
MRSRIDHSNLLLPAASIMALLCAGCYGGTQSVLEPAGIQAERISALWWMMLAICSTVFIAVVAAVVHAVIGARRQRRAVRSSEPIVRPDPAREKRMSSVVIGATALTTIILLVILFSDYSTGRALDSLESEGELAIIVTGHQWWWEIEYYDPVPVRRIRTANEIHIPVGRTVNITTGSTDVIHSFWVPALQGKRDLIPGYTSSIRLRADQPGIYRGQCAEFCGAEHAKMAFLVVAEPLEKFNAWVASQRAPAWQPSDSVARRGQEVFLAAPCSMCHTIQGTIAGGNLGPDLSHLASRMTIGAGILPNRRGHLSGWISDPQGVKPGALMPSISMSPDDLNALVTYLQGLK